MGDSLTCEPCTYSPEPVEDCLQTSSLDIRQLSLWSGNHMPAKSCENAPQTDGSQNCTCGKEMSDCSIHPNTPDKWIASMQASLARICQMLENRLDWEKAHEAASTGKYSGLLGIYNQDTCSLKMSQQSLMGFSARWCCLRASDVGANHHRDRWWLLADSCEIRIKRENDAEIDRCSRAFSRESTEIPHGEKAQISNTTSKGLEGYRDIKIRNGEEYTTISNTCWWETEPSMGRVVNGMASRVDRIKALGNGQVPLQAAVAWKLLGGE